MQVLDFNGASNILQQRYESDPVETAAVKTHPVLADIPKDEEAGGAAFNIAIKYAFASTRGVTVPIALASGSADQYGKFNISELYSDYVTMQVTGQAIDAAMRKGRDAMVKLADETLEGGHLSAMDSLANQMFSNGGGSRGQIATTSGVTTTVITLADSQQALKFQPGMTLQVSVDDGTGGAGVRAGTVQLVGVDPLAGTLTASGNWNATIGAVAAGDYLFMNGDYNAVFTGLSGWIVDPTVTITTALFFGQDRTKNRVGLGGWNYAGKGAAYEDTIAQLLAYICQYGGNPNRIYVSPLDFAQLGKQQSGKVIYDRAEVQAFSNPKLSFKGYEVMHANGSAQIVSDAFCPTGHFYALQLDTWKLYSMGKIARPANNWVGNMWMPSYQDDVQQARYVTRAFLGCKSPGFNGHGTF